MKRAIACLLIALLPVKSGAAGLSVLPVWTMKNGLACYSFDDAKKIVELDAELGACREQVPALRLLSESLKVEVQGLETKNRSLQAQLDAYEKREKGLYQDLKKCSTDLAYAEANQAPSIAWTLLGASAILVGGAVLGYYLRDRGAL